MTENPLLTIKQLKVQIKTPQGYIQAVDGVDLTIHQGEIFALVGESGCGKSMTALAINRLLPDNAYICQGSEIFLENLALHQLSDSKMRKVRKHKIGMIFQDPASALNPTLTIGNQVLEALANGQRKSNSILKKEMIALLEKVRLPHPKTVIHQYPHQLSGGLKQRVVIAIALANSPSLLIADEATTALDVTIQAQVLNLIKELNKSLKMAILLITHDLGIVSQMADNVAVMYAGHIIEKATTQQFLDTPKHPYSKQLLDALPDHAKGNKLAVIPGQVPRLDRAFTLCRFKERCKFVFSVCETLKPKFVELAIHQQVRCHWYDEKVLRKIPTLLRIENLEQSAIKPMSSVFVQSQEEEALPILQIKDLNVHFPVTSGFFKRTVGYIKAVDGITLNLIEGQTLALVGESGCGKTTAGKAVLKLVEATSGEIVVDNENILKLSARKLRAKRGQMQMIFQDPASSMDPRMKIGEIIEEGMIALKVGTNATERQERIKVLLSQVGLPWHFKNRFSHELSGGQRQRVAIARALAVGANLIICDEPTSALDVSVQAQILNLLKFLQEELNISYLFITHNISVVNFLADFVAVMYLGRIVEYGPAQAVLKAPKHPYTQALLSSVPSLKKQETYFKPPKGELPSAFNPPQGCHFSPRCPFVHERCLNKYPPNYEINNNWQVKCYLYSEEEKMLNSSSS
ncbi:MAG: ABC transporter ATP-binding protein [Proteobacteria bacterium]|nr:ABC transporter ATP-binding protein [Pseudomonadota bacterium]